MKDWKGEATTALLVGARRVAERESLAGRRGRNSGEWEIAPDRVFRRFLPGEPPDPTGIPAFLVATSAGEVGVDLDADHMVWDIRYQKPVIVSEFGADAKAGLHGDAGARWTEEYQANVYEHQLAMLNKIPQVRGICPWILMDFRSPRRLLPDIQDNFNRKGLISDSGQKKQAFFVLQKAYQTNSIGHAD